MTARARARNPNAYRFAYAKCSRVPCSTPGCQHKTQTGDARCSSCRQGRKVPAVAPSGSRTVSNPRGAEGGNKGEVRPTPPARVNPSAPAEQSREAG
jgi:hypothetical protein